MESPVFADVAPAGDRDRPGRVFDVACSDPGAHDTYVTEPGRTPVRRGAGPYRAPLPGRRRTAETRGVCQEARGWRGAAAADGPPGPPARESPVSREGRGGRCGASASAWGGGLLVPGRPGPDTWRRLFS